MEQLAKLNQYIDWKEPTLKFFVLCCLFNPIYWNIVARLEYNYKLLTKVYGCGNNYRGCYVLAATIFSLGIFRDYVYKLALDAQPDYPGLQQDWVKVYAAVLFVAGNVLVLSSMYQLGITGTYLGDYFGILMKNKVSSFPFNVTNNPMYEGSTLVFLATGLWYGKLAALPLSVLVFICYKIALWFEEPFTSYIYEQAAKQKKAKGKKSN